MGFLHVISLFERKPDDDDVVYMFSFAERIQHPLDHGFTGYIDQCFGIAIGVGV